MGYPRYNVAYRMPINQKASKQKLAAENQQLMEEWLAKGNKITVITQENIKQVADELQRDVIVSLHWSDFMSINNYDNYEYKRY